MIQYNLCIWQFLSLIKIKAWYKSIIHDYTDINRKNSSKKKGNNIFISLINWKRENERRKQEKYLANVDEQKQEATAKKMEERAQST